MKTKAVKTKPATPDNPKASAELRSTEGLGIGRVYPPKSMFLRNHVGEAQQGKLKYEMATNMNGAPIIHSLQTDKWFVLSWQDILNLAEKAGIDA
jgi:hypothetical protein